uniref:Transposase protein TnpNC n=1 Tax=Corynebacterium glutamicum TaxID=1718 RepID=Q9EUM6_CORGT|nr:transposase protein fragment TnpNC [Corynebacterium glutamicum]
MPVDHTTILTAGSRNTPLSWTSKHGGTGRYLIGRPVPGGWMRLISGSAAGGATSDLAITAGGQTLDFYLSPKRNVAAAKRFLAKALRSNASAGYAVYSMAFKQFVYKEKLISKMAKALETEDKFRALLGVDPKKKPKQGEKD